MHYSAHPCVDIEERTPPRVYPGLQTGQPCYTKPGRVVSLPPVACGPLHTIGIARPHFNLQEAGRVYRPQRASRHSARNQGCQG